MIFKYFHQPYLVFNKIASFYLYIYITIKKNIFIFISAWMEEERLKGYLYLF